MATTREFNNQITGLVAGADYSAAQYKAVKLASTAGQVVLATAADKAAISILQNDPASGAPALLPGVGDIAKAIAGANDIAIGDWLAPNSTSQLTDVTTGFVVAIALEASSAVGDYIRVMINPHEQA